LTSSKWSAKKQGSKHSDAETLKTLFPSFSF
jgi:hypothetical protein